MKALDNVTVEKSYFETDKSEKIGIDLERISEFFKAADNDSFKSNEDFTPEKIIKFCRSFKNSNKNKENRGGYYKESSEQKLELQEVFKLEAQKNNEYSVLAHIMLAQGGVKSKIAYASDQDGLDSRVFVIYRKNDKTMILDAGVQESVIELEEDGVYKHFSKKLNKEIPYTQNIRHSRLVSPKISAVGNEVDDYAPANH